MNLTGFINGIVRLYDGDNLTEEELNSIDEKAALLIEQMKEGSIEYEAQNALDEYIDFYERKNSRKRANALIADYYNTINKKASMQNEMSALNNERKLVMKPLKDNSGVITIIAIIDLVALLGVFIAVIFLALK